MVGFNGCLLKGAHPGQLLATVGIDLNNQIFPICYFVVEVESKDSWSWFLQLLIKDLSINNSEAWTFISYKQKV